MNRTIAFDNKKGVWKTRYSFFSSCIAWVKDLMVTAPIGTSSTALMWKHDELSETNNTFYNVSSPSVVGVSFNDRPSSNKQFKSLSVESLEPNNISGMNTFVVNGKSGSVGAMRQKGGILYGHIGSEDGYTLSNFEFIGKIKAIHDSQDDAEAASGLSFEGVTSGFFVEFYYTEMNALSGGALGVTNNPQGVKNGEVDPIALGNPPVLYNGMLLLDNLSGLNVGDSLFFAYPSSINGESPKGQVADVTLTLGSEDFEVHAVNLEYSPTNLDHSN
tara:strand:- start:971 stop:1792 length:822 start_codon:yes stop_codon:yes gene_type:complete